MILIGDLHCHKAPAGVRQRNRHRPSIEIDNRKRIQRVAVGTENALLDRRSKLAAMPESSETAVLDYTGEIDIGLCAIVVVDGHRDSIACPRLRVSSSDKGQRRQGVDDEFGLHLLFLISPSVSPISGGAVYVPSNVAQSGDGKKLRCGACAGGWFDHSNISCLSA